MEKSGRYILNLLLGSNEPQFKILRDTFTSISTTGCLYLDNALVGYTLERPRVGYEGYKPCIPIGVYQLTVQYSPRFERPMPHLKTIDGKGEVPGYENILIHWGNFVRDTAGCILVGRSRGLNFIGRTRDEFNTIVYPALQERLKSGLVYISVSEVV